MSELVLALHREVLTQQGINTLDALQPIDIYTLPDTAYAMLPRHIAGNKSVYSVELGQSHFGQVIVYMQLVNTEGEILMYQRKSKDGVLEGKWSIGIGGHVSHEDLIDLADVRNDSNLQSF